uniref:Minor histocompatibility antigen H13 n=1 Tax=Fibrocapsa japonica TaxID=94617 RepID=A0A7S2V0H1_9STRA|mmetsp:Transcript_22197/g.32233  ORF Transcript_22197/g.32233 Transcript_22197/m.32233 type:complete len:375 (+) Transcript_22197:77-1201(+)|eukprot:CAMPEP_0113945072 /NCGR_PEP_ID=MMETSP1339-20121228/38468_1 /TAXON_ID=94617 /ORGANISM="Fibrocapsa japonica" /LENGTH=374 /DNA_ID=CAMNT_0000950475 /DNA_START=76 /DNA_END=1200 /DNA_ORIENTATION=- /assembly_acc=CAM_ASM_000762
MAKNSAEVKAVNNMVYGSYAAIFACLAISNFVIIPVPLNLIVTATAIVYVGSHSSIKLLEKPELNADGTPKDGEREVLTQADAYKFPIIGSCALFGLYIVFKFLDKDLVNLLLAIYFSVIGMFTIGSTVDPIIHKFIKSEKKYGTAFTLPYLGNIDLTFTPSELVSLILGTAFAGLYFKTKHWALNNLMGISFCVQGLAKISIGSYKIGAILLAGLFVYDVFWVFGTEVMVTVAKSFDGPIKLLFPRAFATGDEKAQFSMLGLGDIVIPGIFIALLLRFDAVQAGVKNFSSLSVFPKPYFHSGIVAYMLGLGATVFVMYYFNAAQPALFYLVPACLGVSMLVALVKKEVSVLFAYSEEEEEKEDKKSDATKKKQ